MSILIDTSKAVQLIVNQSEISRETKIPQSTISRIVSGDVKSVRLGTIAPILDFLGFILIKKTDNLYPDDVVKNILSDVYDACHELNLDGEAIKKILAAVKGSKI